MKLFETDNIIRNQLLVQLVRKGPLNNYRLSLVVKKLRYYARFIVVCLLLNKNEILKKLMDELAILVED